jgi:hypothetical protein
MPLPIRREQLVRDVVRLRRVQQRNPHDKDVAAVRADLERAIGPTLGRAASARLLGISQTALDRWIAQGEVPVVPTADGRREVPLAVVVELVDALERVSEARHPLAAVLRARSVSARPPAAVRASGHRAPELRSLAYHRAVAERLDDGVVGDARARLRRWRSEKRIHPRYADAWEALLDGPRPRLADAIVADSEDAAALRQSSPLAGALSERERRRALGLA